MIRANLIKSSRKESEREKKRERVAGKETRFSMSLIPLASTLGGEHRLEMKHDGRKKRDSYTSKRVACLLSFRKVAKFHENSTKEDCNKSWGN